MWILLFKPDYNSLKINYSSLVPPFLLFGSRLFLLLSNVFTKCGPVVLDDMLLALPITVGR